MTKGNPKSKRTKEEKRRKVKIEPKKKKSKKSIVKKAKIISYGKKDDINPYEYFIYARYSKKDAEEEKEALLWGSDKETSIKSQVEMMKSIAITRWIEMKEENVIKENESWKKDVEREEFDKMIAKLKEDATKSKRKYGGVLFWKIDRLARNFRDFAELDYLMDQWYEFISATEKIENSYTWRLLFRILAWFAIYESEKLSARIGYSFVRNIMAKNFKRLGGNRLIFWYKFAEKDDAIMIDKNQAEIVGEIYESYAHNIKEYWNKQLFPWMNILDLTHWEVETKFPWKILEHIKQKKTSTTPRNFIENTLKNTQKMKYNGYIKAELDVKDEIVWHLFEEVRQKYKEYDNLVLEWTWKVGTTIYFTFYLPELTIIDSGTYDFVQKFIKREEDSKKKEIPISENRKNEALFLSLVYFQNKYSLREWMVYYKPENKKSKKHNETWHYRTEAKLETDVEGLVREELSEGNIEEYLWQSWIFDNIKKLGDKKHQKDLVRRLQLRQNQYEVKNMINAIGNVRAHEMHLTNLKNRRNLWKMKDIKELEELDLKIKGTEGLLTLAHKELEEIEEIKRNMAKNLEKIIKPSLYAKQDKHWKWQKDIARDKNVRILRSLWYRFMMEQVIINISKSTIEVHFYPEIAKIICEKGEPVITIQIPKD